MQKNSQKIRKIYRKIHPPL